MKASDVLKKEHRNIEKLIKVLRLASDKLAKGESVNPELFISSGSFITQYMDQKHHGKEEKIFFSLMNDYDFKDDEEPLNTFIVEHDQARNHTQALRSAAFQLIQGSEAAKEELLTQTNSYIDLLTHHIRNEDESLFPVADSKFSEATQDKLIKLFDEFDENFDEQSLLKKLEQIERML